MCVCMSFFFDLITEKKEEQFMVGVRKCHIWRPQGIIIDTEHKRL